MKQLVGLVALCLAGQAHADGCAAMRCAAGSVCREDGRSPYGMCVPDKKLAIDEKCMWNNEFYGVCPEGTMCLPRAGVETFVAESYCQPDIAIDQYPRLSEGEACEENKELLGDCDLGLVCDKVCKRQKATCASIQCMTTETCIEDHDGARCVPRELPNGCMADDGTFIPEGETSKVDCNICSCKNAGLICTERACPAMVEGEACWRNNQMLGKCAKGLECRVRDGVMKLGAEKICQRLKMIEGCAAMRCAAGSVCREDGRSPYGMCVPDKKLAIDEKCMWNNEFYGVCPEGAMCLPRAGVETFVAESYCQPDIAIDPLPGCMADDGTFIPEGETGEVDCNICSCKDGLLSCTERACPPSISEGEACWSNNEMLGKCAKGLECRVRDGVMKLGAEKICQVPELIIDPLPGCMADDGTFIPEGETGKVDCNTCWCKRGELGCTKMFCPPAISEGEACWRNNQMLGKCAKGLECRVRDGVMRRGAEKICQVVQERKDCSDKNNKVKDGDSIKDGCTVCMCIDGKLDCFNACDESNEGIELPNEGSDGSEDHAGSDWSEDHAGSDWSNEGSDGSETGSDWSNEGSDGSENHAGSDWSNEGSDGSETGSDWSNEGSDGSENHAGSDWSNEGSDEVGDKVIPKGSVCQSGNEVFGKCMEGLVCRSILRRMKQQYPMGEAKKICVPSHNMYLPEGKVCESGGVVKGKCQRKLRCMMRNSNPEEFVSEKTCQFPKLTLTCATVDCMDDFTCIEDLSGPRCVPVSSKPRYLSFGEDCNRSDMKCGKGLECRSVGSLRGNEKTCQKPVSTCSQIMCEAPNTCFESNGVAKCIPPKTGKDCVDGGDAVLAHGMNYTIGCKSCACNDGRVVCTDNCKLDCEWTARTKAPWTKKHRHRCCKEQGVRCPIDRIIKTIEKCKKLRKGMRTPMSLIKQCCHVGMKCARQKYDCDDDEINADAKKQEWCCRNEDKLCSMDCMTQESLTLDQRDTCCDWKGIGCREPELEEFSRPGFLLKMKGAGEELIENPKAFLRKFRMSMLKASPSLAKNPEKLVVTTVGVLMAGYTMPTDDKMPMWSVSVSLSWNRELQKEEVTMLKNNARTAAALGADSQELIKTATDDGVFAKYYIDGSTHAIDSEMHAALKDASKGMGPLTSTDGSSLVVDPVAEGNTPTTVGKEPTKENTDSESSKTWLYALMGGIGALCMGSAIALTAYSRRNKRTMPPLPETTPAQYTEISEEDLKEMEL
eukprot:TRINITY_DN332_c0_g1_i2.p1 TRINITY_DN332_c0_g1~~TRINITY_DN332_c0_g1_i2.p1  ORF type:complete len:1253 (+),score=299.64 TRINITY_DN332_c0_g1_i2:62-3760(+)